MVQEYAMTVQIKQSSSFPLMQAGPPPSASGARSRAVSTALMRI